MDHLLDDVERHRLARRLSSAVARLDDPAAPLVVVDLDAFDLNATDLVRRATPKPVRLASKSVRVPALARRALAVPGFHGVLAYTLREALWQVAEGVTDDAVMGYPSVDRGGIDRLLGDERALASVTLMVDDPAHLDLVDAVRAGRDATCGSRSTSTPGCGWARPTSAPSARPCTTRRRSSTSLTRSPRAPGSPWSA